MNYFALWSLAAVLSLIAHGSHLFLVDLSVVGSTRDIVASVHFGRLPIDGVFDAQCGNQIASLSEQLKSYPRSVLIAPFNVSYWAETVTLLATLLYSFVLIWKKRTHPIHVRSFVFIFIFAFVLFSVDHYRFFLTSILPEKKYLYTWSSYCLSGDVSYVVSAFRYFMMYVCTGIAIHLFLQNAHSISIGNAKLTHIDIGLSEPFGYLKGARFYWNALSYTFAIAWISYIGLNDKVSVYFIVQAILIITMFILLNFFAELRIMLLNREYQRLIAEKAQIIAQRKGVAFQTIDQAEVFNEFGIKENPFLLYHWPYMVPFWNRQLVLAAPAFIYVAPLLEIFQPWLK